MPADDPDSVMEPRGSCGEAKGRKSSAGVGVGKDVPPFITMHNSGRFAGINSIGLQRRGFSAEQIASIHDAARILFQSGMNYDTACCEVEKQVPAIPERDRLLGFIRESKRGVIKPYSPQCEKDE